LYDGQPTFLGEQHAGAFEDVHLQEGERIFTDLFLFFFYSPHVRVRRRDSMGEGSGVFEMRAPF
jgi:hypothetical protein